MAAAGVGEVGGGAKAAPSPLDPGASGWVLKARAWRSSEVYRALRTAEARHVAELVLFELPRYEPETHYFGGKAFIIRRGQLFAAEETIAELAGTSRKVVRTGLRTLITAGLITREQVHPSGQCPHVITVRDYELSQTLPGNGANETARERPEKGQRRARDQAPSKPQEPHQPHQPQEPPLPSPSAPARRGARRKDGAEPDPRHRPLQERLEAVFLEARGSAYGFQPRDARAVADLLRLSGGDAAEVERRWRLGLGEAGFRRCDTIHELAAVKWNAYAGEAPGNGARLATAAASPASAFRGGRIDLETGLPMRPAGTNPVWPDPDFDDPTAWSDYNAYQARSAPASAVPIAGPSIRSVPT